MPAPASALSAAVEHHKAGRLDEAERLYREVLAGEPENPDALHLLGVLKGQRGDPAAGVELIGKAVALRPAAPAFHNNLGKALYETGQRNKALASYRRAVELAPSYAEAHYNLALALTETGDLVAAETSCRRTLELAPGNVSADKQLAVILMRRERFDEAEPVLRRVAAARADDPVALLGLGRVLYRRGAVAEAEPYARRFVDLHPQRPEGRALLGAVRLATGDLDMALGELRRASELDPKNDSTLILLGHALSALADFAGAQRCYERAAALTPDDNLAWRNDLIRVLYDPRLDEAARRSAHVAFGEAMEARATPLPADPALTRDPARRLRIGWLSSDFRQHPVARNLETIFAYRDPAKFVCYANVLRPDPMTDWFRAQCDLWRPVVGLSDAEVAEQIRADRIDVMVYVAGRFDHNRPQIAAWRPSPVQVSLYDGATSGLKAMDYFIADATLVPPGAPEYFSERVVRLPRFYVHRPLSHLPPPGALPARTKGHVTFGCFNNPAKINDEVLAVWARLLLRLPDAHLRLKYKNWFASRQLQDRIARALGPEVMLRVEFDAVDRPTDDHMMLYGDIDIALDPFPFTGSTTTFEALWMGVPVVTLMGDHFMARWTGGMLHALGLDDLIAPTPEEYVAIAAALADDRGRLAALRAGLRDMVERSSLCDGPGHARHFYRLLRALWGRWCKAT